MGEPGNEGLRGDSLVQHSRPIYGPPADCHNQERYSQESSLYKMMELVWHLCEVLFIEVLPAGCLVQQLLEWVCWHARQEEEVLRSVLMEPQPEEHPEYWRVVYRLVLSGRIQEARDLLSHHSFSHTMPDVSCPHTRVGRVDCGCLGQAN